MERLRSNSKTMEIFLLEYCFTEKINVKHLTIKNKTFSFRTTRFWAKSGYLFLYYYTFVFVQSLDNNIFFLLLSNNRWCLLYCIRVNRTCLPAFIEQTFIRLQQSVILLLNYLQCKLTCNKIIFSNKKV